MVVPAGATGLKFTIAGGTGDADLLDINGDALPDVVDTTGGVHRMFVQTVNTAGVTSLSPVMTSATGSMTVVQIDLPSSVAASGNLVFSTSSAASVGSPVIFHWPCSWRSEASLHRAPAIRHSRTAPAISAGSRCCECS